MLPSPPTDHHTLQTRAQAIAGLTLGELATKLGQPVPDDFRHQKGWTGTLLELALGADAGSRPEPDFTALGIELKTLPINELGIPLETTYICVAPLTNNLAERWHDSLLWKKMRHMLWVPVQGERSIIPSERRIGTPFFWQPNARQEQLLRQDWEELTELIALGHSQAITARQGTVLQLRPKAADGSVRVNAFDAQGNPTLAQPKGFYLKKAFTLSLLKAHFCY